MATEKQVRNGLIILGTTLIVGTFVIFGKASKAKNPSLPVPYDPEGFQLGRGEHFVYRQVYISIVPFSTLSDVWTWTMRGSPSLEVEPLAVSGAQFDTKEAALGDAMKARDAQLGGA